MKLLTIKTDTSRITILISLAEEVMEDNPEKAEAYLSEALILSRKKKDLKKEAQSYAALGQLNWSQSKYDASLKQYSRALSIFEKLKDKQGIASCLGDMGVVHRYKGDYVTALDHYFRALKLYETLGDIDGVGTYLNNIARIYESQKNYDKAIEMYESALQKFTVVDNKDGISTILNNMGLIYDRKAQYDQALNYYKKSLAIAIELEDESSQSISYNNMGQIYKKQGNYPLALEYYNKSLGLKKHIGDKRGTSRTYFNMALIYQYQRNFTKAEELIQTGLELAHEAKTQEMIAEGLTALAFVKAEQKEFEPAYNLYRKSVRIRDSLFTEKSSRDLLEMQAKYENTEKEKAIEMLQKEKEIQRLSLETQRTELSRQKFLRNTFVGGIIIVILFALMLWNRYKIKHKANALLQVQKTQIEKQKTIVEEQNKDIMDSIHYAKRIQDAILPPDQIWKKLLPDSFVFYKPKDIIGGDFYWIEKVDSKIIVAAVDCTGHGVPGALMSIVGYNLLNKAVLEKGTTNPADILKYVNHWLAVTLHQDGNDAEVRDGMDVAICTIDTVNKELQYAGGFNPLYIIRKGELVEYKANRFPLGRFVNNHALFTEHKVDVQPGDVFYIFSDGYFSQFGGEKGKKLMTKNFKNLLIEISSLPMATQKQELETCMAQWKQGFEQVDDMLVIGFMV